MNKKNAYYAPRCILVVGTGTIGEPLIGLLADLKKRLNIDEVIFHKRTPMIDEIAKVNSLIKRGAKLSVNEDKAIAFQKLGHKISYDFQRALEKADVVIDCTPAGNIHKEKHYIKYPEKIFIAQGSEKEFGLPYAYGINDKALLESDSHFIQVVSCNTHNICNILKSLSPNFDSIVDSDFVCIRRANDISQNNSFIASPEVGVHNNVHFGTHHAADASRVLNTLYCHLPIYSSAMKVNSQYMHAIRFNIVVKGNENVNRIINKFKENPFAALTYKNLANKVFSFGRDHGYYGRIFNQTVISIPTLHAFSVYNGTRITGFCFTPQDGNSLLSSIAAALYGICGEDYIKYMKIFDEFLFNEI